MIVCCITFEPDLNRFSKVLQAIDAPLLIIDNGSSKKVLEFLASCKAEKVIYLEENRGIAHASNVGLRYALNAGYDYCCLLDHDSILCPNYLQLAISCFKKAPSNTFAIGPLSVNSTDVVSKNNSELYKANMIIQSGSVVRLEFCNKVGWQLDDWFIDLVDLEWFYRAVSSGYNIFVSRKLVIDHQLGESSIKFFGKNVAIHTSKRIYYRARNTIFALRKHHIPLVVRLRLLAKILFIGISLEARGNEPRMNYVKALCRGLIDGIL